MDEITAKRRYFALYIWEKFIYKGKVMNLAAIAWEDAYSDEFNGEYEMPTEYPIKDCQLILKPLSAISDEDVREVGKAANYGSKNYGKEAIMVILTSGDNAFGLVTNLHIGDYLRSKGYYTGEYMGYNPIELGWARLTEGGE